MAAEDNNETNDTAPPESSTAVDEVAVLKAEIAVLKDRALRAYAEAENIRKRAERDRGDDRLYAISNFARALLPVADNFDRAMAAITPEARSKLDDTMKPIIEGVDAIARQLQAALESHGVKAIRAEGQRFDPNLHQAIAEVPAEGRAPGTVVNVVQGGYTIGERLLRPAMVTVAKAGANSSSSNGAGSDEARGGRFDSSV